MLANRFAVADVDSHIIEPPDLWTSRLGSRWKKIVPHVDHDPRTDKDWWFVGERRMNPVGGYAHAGWPDWFPSYPPTFEGINRGGYEAKSRLHWLDEAGIYYQLLYPNLLGFHSHVFIREGLEFATECVQAYNDFLTDFCSADPSRLIPLTIIPFWDVEASVAEIQRSAKMGHRGVVMSPDYEKIGYPALQDPHWDPILRTCEDLGLPVSFHVGFAASQENSKETAKAVADVAEVVKFTTLAMVGNAKTVAELSVSGLCERYPRLNFVSIESGVGWLPFFMESLDWQWKNSAASKRYSDRLLPSEYIRRQIYFTYWFEQDSFQNAAMSLADNIMFESDFPHPTSLSPGPASIALSPREVVERSLGGLPDNIAEKVLFQTAHRLYHLDAPALKLVQPAS
jgi:predicted TIM-barrel fold metal-dependent hydrolase